MPHRVSERPRASRHASLVARARLLSLRRAIGVLAATLMVQACQTPDVTSAMPPATEPPAPETGSGGAAGDSLDASVMLDLTAAGPLANRRIIGSNVQWVDRGDGLLGVDGKTWDPSALAHATSLAPTVLRYPGGSHSDTYDWRAGMTTSGPRPESEVFFTGLRQSVQFGTPEFLELCRRVGAEAIITVNAITGTAADAAAWVRATNIDGVRSPTGERLPSVRYWEVGNEPYLRHDARPDLWISPQAFAARANDFLRAMRAADPSVQIGIPLMPDSYGSTTLPNQEPNYLDRMLSDVTEPYDFVSLHTAYFPFLWNPAEALPDTAVFRATMGASRVLERDFATIRTRLKQRWPARTIGIAMTEYNALFTLGGARDAYIGTVGGALYVADVLRVLAQTNDLLLANHWSLIGNWEFGALGSTGQPRPVTRVFEAYRDVLRGRLVTATVVAPTFDSPAAGLVPAASGVPSVTVLATTEGATLRLLVLNKDPARPARVRLGGSDSRVLTSAVREFGASSLYGLENGLGATTVNWVARSNGPTTLPATVSVGPHAMLWIELQLESTR